ncbi:hypothetical protein FRZ67_01610 [Panacibacter ginsenosidivorans]|uniref:Uncharacterized protein n=1 Tax=Panacibacter ginsenosidivorans TaxID=1813871 RepID=A0A5B8V3V8_9BACT|nr:hypothetical protein [Panacibacter ginsenosidivorans]QEC66064.1 hypothetical protein FRZ67_01610 [Panacibacter ginsenosidivorans]
MKRENLIDEAMALTPAIRYVATYINGDLLLKERSGIIGNSSSESDKYEELIVNPALLKLTTQRGNIDCGGLNYIIIRYNNFFVMLFPVEGGHVNFGFEPDANPFNWIGPISSLLGKH